MKDLGELKNFLGIQFERVGDSISMSHEDYTRKILSKFDMADCKPRGTPCEANTDCYEGEESKEPVDQHIYRQMVRSLVYVMVSTKPDLSFAVTKLSQGLSCPTQAKMNMLKHVFRYLKKTVDRLTYSKSHDSLKITAYCDADWAASSTDRQTISGYCLSLISLGLPISWKAKRQASVALSTCEAEYMSLAILCQEVIYVKRNLLPEFVDEDVKTVVYCDNQGTIALSKNPTKHGRSKHI